MGTPSISTLGKLAIDVSTVTGISDFDAGSTQLEFLSESVKMQQSHFFNDGIRGTRSRAKERVRITQEAIGGSITLHPTPAELNVLFPLILGTAESADVFAVAETVMEFGILIERIAKRFIYTGCFVNQATFSGSQGGPVTLTLDILGKTEVISATTFPATIPAIDYEQPYVMSDVTFALGADASATECAQFTITINNALNGGRFMNSLTRNSIPATDRIITMGLVVPYTADEVDLHDQAVAGGTGTLTITNGGQSTLFTFANLKAPADSPTHTSRGGEVMLNLNMTAYQSTTTKELVVTHDAAA